MSGRKFTSEEDNFLRENYLTIPAKRMAKMLGRSEGTARQRMKILSIVVPGDIIEKFKQDSYIKKGNVSFNKGKKQTEYMSAAAIEKTKATRFKKGNKPHCTKPEASGVITTRKDKRTGFAYKYIKVADANWKELHRQIYEQTHGPIPKGMCVAFIDHDQLNVDPTNLELITQAENMKRNSLHNYPKEITRMIQLRGVLNRKINKKLKNLKHEK